MTPRKIVAFIHTYMPDGELDPYMLGVLDGFVQEGVQVYLIKTNELVWNLGDKALARQFDEWKILDFIENVAPDFIFTTNRGGVSQALIDDAPCPILTWLVDIVPFMHHGGTKEDLYGDKDFIFTSSSSNVPLLEKEYPFLKGHVFYEPFATSLDDFTQAGLVEKDIPLSFVGTYFGTTQLHDAFEHYEADAVTYAKLKELTCVLASNYTADVEAEIARLDLGAALDKIDLSPMELKSGVSNLESANRRIKVLEALVGEGLRLYGTRNWIDIMSVSLPLFCAFDPTPISTREKLANVYQRSKISVNVSHLQAMGGLPYRVFDIMASSSMLLAGEESRPDLELLFGKDMPLPLYRDPAHARELTRYYLDHDDERRSIVTRSNDLIRHNFGFGDRVRRMYALVRPDRPSAPQQVGQVIAVSARQFRADWTKPLYFFADHTPAVAKEFLRNMAQNMISRKVILMLKERLLLRKKKEHKHKGRVVAIVVTYNSDEGFAQRLDSYCTQVHSVVVVDNSTDEAAALRIRAVVAERDNVRLLCQNGNIGLAAGQNIGLRDALDNDNPQWLLLVDDDSLVPPAMVRTLQSAWVRYPMRHRIGMVAPRVIDSEGGRESNIIAREGWLRLKRRFCSRQDRVCDTALTVIASGSLINADALRECGFFRDDYFIDGVDIEFALRLRRREWRILVPHGATLAHRLGRKTEHRLLGQTFIVTNHPVWRRYTIYRNRVDVWKHYALTFPTYVAYDFMVAVFEAFKVLAFEEQRGAKACAMLRGLRDGIAGRFPRPVP